MLYHSDDISSLKNEIQEFQECFSASDPLQNSIEHNWQLLKDTIQKAISRSKLARHHDKLPWITPLIKQKESVCMIRPSEQTSTQTGVTKRKLEKKVRNEVNSLLETAHCNYCTNMFSDSSSKKRFWCILNKQFQSVFTTEDLPSAPQLDNSTYPSIQDLSFSVSSIQVLLEKLDPAKTPGPDHLLTKVIKLCAHQIASVLQIIYSNP